MWCMRRVKEVAPWRVLLIFSNTESYYVKFYKLVIHSFSRKSGMFYCIIYRTDNITLLLVVSFDDIKNYLNSKQCKHRVNTFRVTINAESVLRVPSQPVSKTLDSFVHWTCGKLSHIFSSVTIQKLFWLRIKVSKTSCYAPEMWYLQGIRRTASWPLQRFNHLRTVHVQALLSSSCSVCIDPCISLNPPLPSGSSRLQSLMNFNEIQWNNFNYFMQKYYIKIMSR